MQIDVRDGMSREAVASGDVPHRVQKADWRTRWLGEKG